MSASAPATPQFLMVPGAPAPVAPFSHAVRVGPWVFVTGQMPTDPLDDGAPLPEGAAAQTTRVMENLKLVLSGAGCDLSHVVQARVYLLRFDQDYATITASGRVISRLTAGPPAPASA